MNTHLNLSLSSGNIHSSLSSGNTQSSLSLGNTHSSLSSGHTHSNNQERAEPPPGLEEVDLEMLAINFLCPYSTHPDWKQIVSSFNECGQTIAHISVTLGYSQLLQHLFTWEINLNIVDNMGSTALHYAYHFGQEECAKFLIQSGADALLLDTLGRSPSDLDPSMEVRLHATVGHDSDNNTHSASSAICTIRMPGEAEGRYAKHFFLRQWGRQIEDEKNDEIHPGPVDQHSQLNSNYPSLVLHRIGPSEGPVSGGPAILLSGTNFPSRPTVYARFGTVVVPTV